MTSLWGSASFLRQCHDPQTTLGVQAIKYMKAFLEESFIRKEKEKRILGLPNGMAKKPFCWFKFITLWNDTFNK